MALRRYLAQYVRKHHAMLFGKKYMAAEKFIELAAPLAEKLSMGEQRNTQLYDGTSLFYKIFCPTEKGDRENEYRVL